MDVNRSASLARPRRCRRALALALTLGPAAAVAADPGPGELIEQIDDAFREDDIDRAAVLLDALVGRPELDPADRLWGLRNRLLVLDRLDRPCELVDATDLYVEAAADDEREAVDRERARRRQVEAVAECEIRSRPEELPPPLPPPPPPPPKGRGTIAVGGGALLVDPGDDAITASQINAEASLGYAWASGFQFEGAVVVSAQSPIAVTVRPGLRIDLFDLMDGGPLQVRVAGQVLIANTAPGVRVGGGLLGGLGALFPLTRDFGLLASVEASLWPAGVHLTGDGRLGVFYAF